MIRRIAVFLLVGGVLWVANGVLAGSVLTLDQAVRNCMQFAGWSLQNALTAATTNPARVARLQNRGSLMAGSVADLVVMDSAGRVLETIVSGQIA